MNVPNTYHATLHYLPLQGAARAIDSTYLRAMHDPIGTAWAALGKHPGGRYRITIRPVTPSEMGMVELPA